MEKFVERYLGRLAVGLLVLEILGLAGWWGYRYGGTHYDLRITHRVGTRPLSQPVNYQITGSIYRGRAVNAAGHSRMVTLKTNSDNPGPFRYGQWVRVTVNPHYGVTHYRVLKSAQHH
ncbi:hypothetical protein LZY01_22000 [Levilactobacillus zymae]|uniref:DUF1093 domain-containing protein n=1 Tax=Levilactobacillus zymae TaxID=267363 RepID=A0ABQ0X405_9LACO|nr:DUF1093 domain-containing protein [Levilactobacillus zymae]GEO73032.1 hypothetical protein LZY01_22000 [Levilactobacillus zymae]